MTETEEPSPEFTVLGKRNEIPVTVENMQQAYENIRKNKTAKQWPGDNSGEMRLNTGDYQITTTHYYVKFTPQDSTQYFTITNDSILSVSDVPFEYEIEVNGSKYQDPDLVGTDFTYYYSVVPVDYNIPENVPYEILANLHFTKEDDIPDDAPEEELQQVDFFHDLNMEAQKISNNLENIEKEDLLYIFVNSTGEEEVLTWQEAQNRGLNLNDLIINFQDYDYGETDYFERRRRWRPSGIITVKEDIIKQNVGVAGAKVKVRKWGWVVIRNAYTNDSGYFITSSTRTKRVKYSVHFHNSSKGFKIKAGHIFWNARHIGQHTYIREPWYQNFNNTSSRSHFHALVHNAAYDYYKRAVSQFGLHKPNQSWLRITAKFNWEIGDSNHFDINPNGQIPWIWFFSFWAEIRVGRKSNGSYAGSDKIYATVTHEMTHASHYRLDRSFFILNNFNCEREVIAESWAEGVETIVTNHRYRGLSNNYNSVASNSLYGYPELGYNGFRQDQSVGEMTEYTPLVIDLHDNFNQNNQISSSLPNDRVKNFTLLQMQRALNDSRGLVTWRQRLKNQPTVNSDVFIDELFNEYPFQLCE